MSQSRSYQCLIERFRANPADFIVDSSYMCDVPCGAPETTSRLTRACGRVIVPCIEEDATKGFVPDSFSPRCAVAAGTVITIATIDTRATWFLGGGQPPTTEPM